MLMKYCAENPTKASQSRPTPACEVIYGQMINSPDPSAVASRITLAPRYFLSGWGSGRSRYSSSGRCLVGIFHPSPVVSRAVVSAISNPPCSQMPLYPLRMLLKRLSRVNTQRIIYLRAHLVDRQPQVVGIKICRSTLEGS